MRYDSKTLADVNGKDDISGGEHKILNATNQLKLLRQKTKRASRLHKQLSTDGAFNPLFLNKVVAFKRGRSKMDNQPKDFVLKTAKHQIDLNKIDDSDDSESDSFSSSDNGAGQTKNVVG